MLLVDPDPFTQEACGIATLLDPGHYISPVLAADYIASSILDIDCGGASLTFSHEIGHILGGNHDASISSNNCNLGTESCGWTNYSAQFRTIMAAATHAGGACLVEGCARVNRFSNYAKTITLSGTPYALGNGSSENFEATLGDTVPYVAGYSDASASAPASTSGMSGFSCFNNHTMSWTPGSGDVGWHEVQIDSTTGFTFPTQVYRGGEAQILLNLGGSFYARARSCNPAGCGGWSVSSLFTSSGCP